MASCDCPTLHSPAYSIKHLISESQIVIAHASNQSMPVRIRPITPAQTIKWVSMAYFVALIATTVACAGVACAAFWTSAPSSCELTSKKWYTTMRIIATEPRKMARLYSSLSEIIVFLSELCMVFWVSVQGARFVQETRGNGLPVL